MMIRLVAAIALFVISVTFGAFPAQAQDTVTRAGAVLCVSPFSLVEAGAAASNGIPVLLIDDNSLGMKARLRLPNGEGATLWGKGGEFVSTSPPPDRPAATAPSPTRKTEDVMFTALKQTIIGSGHDCERMLGYMSSGAVRTVTCQN